MEDIQYIAQKIEEKISNNIINEETLRKEIYEALSLPIKSEKTHVIEEHFNKINHEYNWQASPNYVKHNKLSNCPLVIKYC